MNANAPFVLNEQPGSVSAVASLRLMKAVVSFGSVVQLLCSAAQVKLIYKGRSLMSQIFLMIPHHSSLVPHPTYPRQARPSPHPQFSP